MIGQSTEAAKIWQWKTIDRQRASFIDWAQNRFYKAFDRQLMQAMTDGLAVPERITSEPIMEAYMEVYLRVGTYFGNNTYSSLAKRGHVDYEQKQEEEDSMFFLAIKDFVAGALAGIIESVTQTSQQRIAQLVQTAQANPSLSLSQARIFIMQAYRQVLVARAAMTARTEVVRASNKTMLLAAAATGLTLQKEWLSTRDSRVRRSPGPDHLHPDGQRRYLAQPFMVSGELLQFPAAPGGSPKNTVNCRCTMNFVL